MIDGIESKEGLPEKYTERSKSEMKDLLTQRIQKLGTDQTMTDDSNRKRLQNFVDLGQFLAFLYKTLST